MWRLYSALGCVATVLAVSSFSAAASAQSASGTIQGRVTDKSGAGIGNIDVEAQAAQPGSTSIGGDAKTDAGGNYSLSLPAGSYDVGFNVGAFVAPYNTNYETAVYGASGPPINASCVVCGGTAVTVTAGAVTGPISVVLAPAASTLSGYIRPLSGKTIRARHGSVPFKVGCHEYPHDCTGTARLLVASGHGSKLVSTTPLQIPVNGVRVLRLRLPRSVLAALGRAGYRGLRATVLLKTPQSSTSTHFRLVGGAPRRSATRCVRRTGACSLAAESTASAGTRPDPSPA